MSILRTFAVTGWRSRSAETLAWGLEAGPTGGEFPVCDQAGNAAKALKAQAANWRRVLQLNVEHITFSLHALQGWIRGGF
jgi:hypothetical protein